MMVDELYRAEVERRVYDVLIREGLVEDSAERCFHIDSLDGLELVIDVGEEFGIEVDGEDLAGMIDGDVVQVKAIVDYLVSRNVE